MLLAKLSSGWSHVTGGRQSGGPYGLARSDGLSYVVMRSWEFGLGRSLL